MDFKNLKVHFIGIGGIGVSALARLIKAQGAVVSGSDIFYSHIVKDLEKEGIRINIPHEGNMVEGKDVVIHSAIIKSDNVELQEALRRDISILSRKEAIKILLSKKKVLSICAAHGKSSTSAILSSILPGANALIGAISKEFNSNARIVDSEILVFEADESDKSFLNSNPYVSIVLNAEAEHLESYENNFSKLKNSYVDFMNLSKKVIINTSCCVLDELKSSVNVELIVFNPDKDLHILGYELIENIPYIRFSLLDYGEFKMQGIGAHNAINASMAIICATEFLDIESIKNNLLNFKGIKKRFDILQNLDSSAPCIIDDYAHHPTEIRATLSSCKIYQDMLPFKREEKHIIAIFQPHKYSRLRDNLDDFIECFKLCDRLIILPVYAAGEAKIDFDFEALFKKYNPTFVHLVKKEGANLVLLDDCKNTIEILDSGIIIGLGAGDITYQLRG